MNRGVLRILIGLAAVIAVVILLGFALPRTSVMERSDEIAAPPATVYELLVDLRAARRWSPWREPRARYLFSGPLLGVGATMDWSGGGSGRTVVAQATPYRRVVHAVDAGGRARLDTFRLTRSAQGTRLTWRREADAGGDPLARWEQLLSRAAMRANLERGLERLGDVAEALPHADMAAAGVRLVQVPARPFAFVEGETERDPAAVARALTHARAKVAAALRRAGAAASGGPIWIVLDGPESERVRYRAGLAFEGAVTPNGSGLVIGRLDGGAVIQAEHHGALDGLPQAEAAARLFQGIHQLAPGGPAEVEFAADPAAATPDSVTATFRLPVRSGP